MGGMRGRHLHVGLVTVALLLVSIFVYGAGYLWLGTKYHWSTRDDSQLRIYRHWWMAKVFAPAARLESWATGREVKPAVEVNPNFLQIVD
jgi:hypothetical protein